MSESFNKKRFLSRSLILQLLVFTLLLLNIQNNPAYAAAESVYIKVKSTRLRSVAQHYAASLDTLVLGDSVQLLKRYQGWYEIKTLRGKIGYIHESAVSERKIVLTNSTGKNYGSSDSSDVVLAGKGFNQEVEKQFASQNPTLNFKAVDEIERIRVNESDLLAFVKAGGLKSDG